MKYLLLVFFSVNTFAADCSVYKEAFDKYNGWKEKYEGYDKGKPDVNLKQAWFDLHEQYKTLRKKAGLSKDLNMLRSEVLFKNVDNFERDRVIKTIRNLESELKANLNNTNTFPNCQSTSTVTTESKPTKH